MKRLLAIGDIHGYLAALEKVLEEAAYNPEEDLLILLGDYIDRGKDSYGVVEKVRKLVSFGAIALRGNHEALMIDAIDTHDSSLWNVNGGKKTINSYRRKGTNYQFDRKMYLVHYMFLKKLPLYHCVTVGDMIYFFSHAGIDFDKPLEEQTEADLTWNDDKFIDAEICGDIVFVSGHVRVQAIRQRRQEEITAEPIFLPNKIFLDTGIDNGGKLTVCDVLKRECWQAGEG